MCSFPRHLVLSMILRAYSSLVLRHTHSRTTAKFPSPRMRPTEYLEARESCSANVQYQAQLGVDAALLTQTGRDRENRKAILTNLSLALLGTGGGGGGGRKVEH
ncbi:hypothetical protein E2C01_021471 [Portunus trituberculatus]|uniref:Uncharacterized protein n=1 Tax=Portunus trituberculatus TaxID=210409 RepID=A0A5B7E2M0_PORTR|nr:hypothetical protein [Portunus trituberculatus]